MSSRPELKIDWATYQAAKYACEHWHYSGCMPGAKKQASLGVWERGQYIGAIIFSPGATADLGKPYGLNQLQCTELVRVALNKHENPVTKMIAVALKMIKKHSPGIRLIVSFADPYRDHNGGIYQAGNWVYTGTSTPTKVFRYKGKIIHPRTLGASGFKKGRKKEPPVGAEKIILPGKHRYLMPLDDEMKKQIEPLKKPYPKRVTKATSGDQSEGGGAIPTHALQNKRDKQAIGGDHPHSGGAAPTVTLQKERIK